MTFLYIMKKIFITFFLAVAMLGSGSLMAQNVRFSKYFEDATLRIDYQRAGNRSLDTILGCYDERLSTWAGSLTRLVDPFDNGAFRIVMKDVKDGKIIYSRGFNSLFAEYRDTPEGKDSIRVFEEVVRLPWPKRPVDICWEERGADQKFHTQSVLRYNPEERAKVISHREYKAKTVKVDTLQYMGDSHKKIDIVIVPEGYGPADTTKMKEDFAVFCRCIFAHEPFKRRARDFNIWGIHATGRESGITDSNKGIAVNSLVGASYNTFGADRYLMTMRLFKLHDAIGNTPCDHIIIMANSPTYGGGGIYNFYAMSSLNYMASMVLPHELGHSIGGLADEYVDEDLSYGDVHSLSQEPVEPNITSLVNFDQKWKKWLPKNAQIPTPPDEKVQHSECGPLGVYEGAGYHSKGLYRPTMRCMMRDYAPFCPVCVHRLNEVFNLYVR